MEEENNVNNESIFSNQENNSSLNENSNNVKTNAPIIQLPDEVKEVVGEGKKYKTLEDALKSVPHAQKHINTLEQELAELKEQLAKSKSAEKVLEELTKEKTPTPTAQPVDIDSVIEKKLQEKAVREIAQSNINKVVSTFKENYGEKAEEVFLNISKETGLSLKYLNELSAQSPEAVFKIAGIAPKAEIKSVKGSTINTASLPTNQKVEVKSVMSLSNSTTKDYIASIQAIKKNLGYE